MGKKKGGGVVRVKQLGPKAPPLPQTLPFHPMMMEALQPQQQPSLSGAEGWEEIHLPPAPDRNYQVVWPIHEAFTLDATGFRVIYPSYLDATKTTKQGRRVALEVAVPRPTMVDLSQALQSLHIRHVLQPYKCYSRESAWDNPGRVLVDGSARNDDDDGTRTSKRRLLPLVAARIATLPDRITRLQREQQEEQEHAQRAAQQAEQQQQQAKISTSAAAASDTTKKTAAKKGKKGKKK